MFLSKWKLAGVIFAVVFIQSTSLLRAEERFKPYKVLNDRRVPFPLASLTFSRDGKLLASVSATYAPGALGTFQVVLVDVASGQTLHKLEAHSAPINRLAFSPDGKTLYSGFNPHKGSGVMVRAEALYVWDVTTGKRLKELTPALWDLSPDGKTLATADNVVDIDPGFDGRDKPRPPTYTVKVLDTATWKEVSRLEDKGTIVTTLGFAADGNTLALGMSDYTIRLWDSQTRKETGRIQASKIEDKRWPGGTLTFVAFSPDGKMLASVTDHGFVIDITRKVELWDVAKRTKIRTLNGPQSIINGLAFTPKGDQLALSCQENTLQLFDVASGETVKELKQRSGRSDLALALYRAGVTAEQSPVTARLWDLATGDSVQSGKMPDQVQCLALAPDDRTLAVGDQKGVIRLYDIATGKEVRQFTEATKSSVGGLIYLQGGKLLASQHHNGQFRFWDPETGKVVPQVMAGFATGTGRPLAFSPDGKVAAGGGRVFLWTSLMDKKPVIVKIPKEARAVQFTPDGKKLLAGAWEGSVQVIDVTTAQVVSTIGRDDVSEFALSPDGRTVVTWGHTSSPAWKWDKHVRLWDLTTGEERGELAVTPTAFNGLVFTPDGSGLFVEHDGGVGLWEMSTGQQRGFFQGHWPLAVSSKGRLLVTKTEDCIFIWDLTGRNNGGVLDASRPTPDELKKLWDDLQASPGEAQRALWRLAGAPEQTVPFLAEKLGGVPALDPKRVASLIADLNHDDFNTRQKAQAELPKYGRWALTEARATLAKEPPPEVRRRLEEVLPQLRDYPFYPEQTLALRVVEVLEQSGTPEARRLLEKLAGKERPQFTEAAQAALERLGK